MLNVTGVDIVPFVGPLGRELTSRELETVSGLFGQSQMGERNQAHV